MATQISFISRLTCGISYSTIRRQALFMLAAFIFVLIWSPGSSPLYASSGIDCSIFRVMGCGILHGRLPYREIFDHKSPLIFYIFAIAESTGYFKWAMTVIQTFFLYVGINALYRADRLLLDKKASLVALCLSMAFAATAMGDGPQPEFFELPFIALSLYLSLKTVKTGRIHRPLFFGVLQGIFIGIIMLMRLNDAVSPPAVALLCVMIYICLKDSYKSVGHIVFGVFCGFTIVTLPFVIYFAIKGLLPDLWYGMYTFNIKYISIGYSKNIFAKVTVLSFMFIWSIAGSFLGSSSRRITIWILIPVLLACVFTIGNNPYMHYYLVLVPVVNVIVANTFSILSISLAGWVILVGGWNMGSSTPLFRSLLQVTYVNYQKYKNNHDVRLYHQNARKLIDIVPPQNKCNIWNYNLNAGLPMEIFASTGIIPANTYFIPQHKFFDPDIQERENIFDKKPEWVLVNESFDAIAPENKKEATKEKFLNMYTKKGSIAVEDSEISLYHLNRESLIITCETEKR